MLDTLLYTLILTTVGGEMPHLPGETTMDENEYQAPPPAPWMTQVSIANGPAQIPMPPTAVSSAAAQLEKAIAQLDGTLDMLLRRIESAMGPDTPKQPIAPTPGQAPRPASSPLVSSLLAKAETVEAITKRIAAATARVEL